MKKTLVGFLVIVLGTLVFSLINQSKAGLRTLSDLELSQVKGGQSCVVCEGPCITVISGGNRYTECEGECTFYECPDPPE